MNICNDTPKKEPNQLFVPGHLYKYRTGFRLCVELKSILYLFNIKTGTIGNQLGRAPVPIPQNSMYTDVTDQYCLKKIEE